jgi:hypothetical protein
MAKATNCSTNRGFIDRSLPFGELKARSLINPLAQAADSAPEFSRLIRVGLPLCAH